MWTPRNDQPGASEAVGAGVEVEPGVAVLVGASVEVAGPAGVSVVWASGVLFGASTVAPGVVDKPMGVKVGEGVVAVLGGRGGEEVNRTVLVAPEGGKVGALVGDKPAIAPATGGEAVRVAWIADVVGPTLIGLTFSASTATTAMATTRNKPTAAARA
jgi:hypothetical protein